MATTTNSLIPASTPASGSPTPTGDTGNIISDLFSSAGSPPLIVAFFSIGLFFVVMLGVFGWRRLSQPRGVDAQVVIPNRRHKPVSLGKKPMLWDVWVDPKASERSRIEARRWDNMTPMSAVLTFLIPPPPVDPLPVGSTDPNGRVLFRTLRSAVKRLDLPKPDEIKEVAVSPASDEIEWGDASSLHVSVIITMPTQRRCCSGTSGEDTDPELGEFCIGTTDVPCSRGG